MKCPKCGYLGFDSSDRCKNCGYEFSLVTPETSAPAAPDVPLTRGARFRRTPGQMTGPGVDRRLAEPLEGTPLDLPLFGDGLLPPPRAPLSVRRATPTPSRGRVRTDVRQPVPLELKLEPSAVSPPKDARQRAMPPEPVAPATTDELAQAAPLSLRFGAAAIDVLLVAAIDAVLLTFTLRLCGLAPAEIGFLPMGPLLAFLILLNGGYLVLFTGTLGQTLGKMAVGIRVVPMGCDAMDLPRAAWRALAMLLSIGPAGLGFLPAAFGDTRALHDRLAGTRVIQHVAVS